MSNQQRFAERDDSVRRYEYDDVVVLAADLGPGTTSDASVDVVDGTAVVVVGDQQYEFPVPAGRAVASINNGVVTVEVERA